MQILLDYFFLLWKEYKFIWSVSFVQILYEYESSDASMIKSTTNSNSSNDNNSNKST